MKNNAEIILYQFDTTSQIEVKIKDDTVWLTLNQISDLFERDKSVISRHIKKIFDEQELDENQTLLQKMQQFRLKGEKTYLDKSTFITSMSSFRLDIE